MSQNVPKPDGGPLTGRKLRAAELVAADELTDEEISSQVDCNRRTLTRWKNEPVFVAAVERLVGELEAVGRRYALSKRARRVQALTNRWEKMQRVIEARGADPEHAKVPGGDTGLLVRVLKGLGGGGNFQVVEEFSFDAALVRELREHERQAAQELGQLVNKVAPTMPDGETPWKAYAGFSPEDV